MATMIEDAYKRWMSTADSPDHALGLSFHYRPRRLDPILEARAPLLTGNVQFQAPYVACRGRPSPDLIAEMATCCVVRALVWSPAFGGDNEELPPGTEVVNDGTLYVLQSPVGRVLQRCIDLVRRQQHAGMPVGDVLLPEQIARDLCLALEYALRSLLAGAKKTEWLLPRRVRMPIERLDNGVLHLPLTGAHFYGLPAIHRLHADLTVECMRSLVLALHQARPQEFPETHLTLADYHPVFGHVSTPNQFRHDGGKGLVLAVAEPTPSLHRPSSSPLARILWSLWFDESVEDFFIGQELPLHLASAAFSKALGSVHPFATLDEPTQRAMYNLWFHVLFVYATPPESRWPPMTPTAVPFTDRFNVDMVLLKNPQGANPITAALLIEQLRAKIDDDDDDDDDDGGGGGGGAGVHEQLAEMAKMLNRGLGTLKRTLAEHPVHLLISQAVYDLIQSTGEGPLPVSVKHPSSDLRVYAYEQ